MRPILAIVTAAIAAALPTAALADYTYTFQVPVKTTNNVAGSAVQAVCGLFDSNVVSVAPIAKQASSFVPLTPAGGAYSGTLSVKVSAPAKPVAYMCWLVILADGAAINIQNGTPYQPTVGWTGLMYTSGKIP